MKFLIDVRLSLEVDTGGLAKAQRLTGELAQQVVSIAATMCRPEALVSILTATTPIKEGPPDFNPKNT